MSLLQNHICRNNIIDGICLLSSAGYFSAYMSYFLMELKVENIKEDDVNLAMLILLILPIYYYITSSYNATEKIERTQKSAMFLYYIFALTNLFMYYIDKDYKKDMLAFKIFILFVLIILFLLLIMEKFTNPYTTNSDVVNLGSLLLTVFLLVFYVLLLTDTCIDKVDDKYPIEYDENIFISSQIIVSSIIVICFIVIGITKIIYCINDFHKLV